VNQFQKNFLIGLPIAALCSALVAFPMSDNMLPFAFAVIVSLLTSTLSVISTLEYANNKRITGPMQWSPGLAQVIPLALPLAIATSIVALGVYRKGGQSEHSLMFIAYIGLLGLHLLNFYNGVLRGHIEPLQYARA
jgi:phosphatidylserine synthase